MKISLGDLTSKIVLFYPAIYLASMLVSDSLARKVALCFLVLLGIQMIRSRAMMDSLAVMIAALFSVLSALRFGVSYVIHLDFYGFILLILIFAYYSNERRIIKLEEQLLNVRLTNSVFFLSFFVVLVSVVFGNGLQKSSEWGVSMPMLFGPYGLPHSLAYQMLILYVLASILWHKYKTAKYLLIMAVAFLCLVWTGVRSAFVSIAIVVLCDYCSIRRKDIKISIMIVGGVLLLYLLFFTDVLTNNPIVQKTLSALSKGSISNSRDDFNSYLSRVFRDRMNLFEKILGMGMVQLRKTMWSRYATELHAHNDIFNALIGHGIVGLSAFFAFFISFCKERKGGMLVFVTLMALAYTNGLYMYVAFTPCIPFFLIYGMHIKKTWQFKGGNVVCIRK